MTDDDQVLRGQLLSLIDESAPTLSAEQVLDRLRATGRLPSKNTSHRAHPKRRLVLVAGWVTAIVVLGALSIFGYREAGGPATTSAPGKVTDYLEVPKQIVSGPDVQVTLVVSNPGGNLNLTQGCAPTLIVTLMKTLSTGAQSRPHDCFGGAYILHHGVTRITTTMGTTYQQCSDGGNVPTTWPPCSGDLHNPVPPLPPGRYFAVASWNWPVKYLPAAQPVSVVVTGT